MGHVHGLVTISPYSGKHLRQSAPSLAFLAKKIKNDDNKNFIAPVAESVDPDHTHPDAGPGQVHGCMFITERSEHDSEA